MVLSVCACGEKSVFNLEPDFMPLRYYICQDYKFLGRKENDTKGKIGGIYSVKSLSSNEYVCHKQYSIITPNGEPSITLYKNKNVDEPILRFAVDEVRITIEKNEYIINDKASINAILAIIRGREANKIFNIPDTNTCFFFDLPCEMVWICCVSKEISETNLIWFDEVSGNWYTADVSNILNDYLN